MRTETLGSRARVPGAGVPFVLLLCALFIGGQVAGLTARAAENEFDWSRARTLRQKQQSGATLTADERAYLERAMAARRDNAIPPAAAALAELTPAEREQARELLRKRRNGETLTDADRVLLQKIRSASTQRAGGSSTRASSAVTTGAQDGQHASLIPLTDMTAEQTYKGRDGGLYGAGQNRPPPAHLEAAMQAAMQIVPRAPGGEPAPNGKVVLLAVGMSNTTQEFSRFKQIADRDEAKADHLVLVDGAQGGQAAAEWAAPADTRVWQTVERRLEAARVTAAQVQVAWIKQAEKRPTEPFPEHAKTFEANLETIVQRLKTTFPNLQIVYLSSRTYGGYATTNLNPEPYAYETAFAVRDLLRRQIDGAAELNFDPAKGRVRAPVLLWGPYLWANGARPRASDGFAWERADFREDGTHPSPSGREKVAQQLLAFFKSDPTAKPWFLARSGSGG